MFCEKCGKSNSPSAAVCAHCGAPMPKKSGSGGFSDILSYEAKAAPAAPTTSVAHSGGLTSAALTPISNSVNALSGQMSSVIKRTKTLFITGIVSLGVGALALLIAIIALLAPASAPASAPAFEDSSIKEAIENIENTINEYHPQNAHKSEIDEIEKQIEEMKETFKTVITNILEMTDDVNEIPKDIRNVSNSIETLDELLNEINSAATEKAITDAIDNFNTEYTEKYDNLKNLESKVNKIKENGFDNYNLQFKSLEKLCDALEKKPVDFENAKFESLSEFSFAELFGEIKEDKGKISLPDEFTNSKATLEELRKIIYADKAAREKKIELLKNSGIEGIDKEIEDLGKLSDELAQKEKKEEKEDAVKYADKCDDVEKKIKISNLKKSNKKEYDSIKEDDDTLPSAENIRSLINISPEIDEIISNILYKQLENAKDGYKNYPDTDNDKILDIKAILKPVE